ncbi:Protein bimA [Spathaspora sp. JA1]|nr:Protein bimA [Spathaspora sp. JA1]
MQSTTAVPSAEADGHASDPISTPSSPNQQYIQQHLRSIIIHSLDTFNYPNAEFTSERLLAITEDDDQINMDSMYLYCLVLFRQRKYKSCYFKLVNISNLNHLGCLWLFAKCCLQLDKCKEGIYQLLKVSYMYNSDKASTSYNYFSSSGQRFEYECNRTIYPDIGSIYHVLGDLYREINDVKNSALNYTSALKYNQFDFEAFQQLCKLGVNVRVKALYKSTTTNYSKVVFAEDSFVDNSSIGLTNPFASDTKKVSTIHHDDSFTNTFSTPRIKHPSIPDAPLRKSNLNNNSHNSSHNDTFEFTKPSFPSSDNEKKKDSTYSKITSRLISQPATTATTTTALNPELTTPAKRPVRANLKRNNSATLDSGLSHHNHLQTSISSSSSTSSIMITKEIEKSEKYLLDLYIIFAKSFKSMSKYDCYKAIRLLESLNDNDKQTPWVLSKLGRLHYEIVNYKQSEYYFNKLRKLDRTRLEDMEYFSTLLWHLHRKVELTYLANELHDLDSTSPITWCTIGNLFSLTHEPDEAIKCFNKSIKLDNKFAYAYTLKGHEYFGNDNYEMALESFRISLLLNPRHYNALYGIGMVYINLGDYQKADYHFRKAVSINPINIILICCVGMVLEKLNKKNLALRQYELANKLQPLNPLPLFKKAQLLFSLQQYSAALKNFEILKELAPDEASVHFLLGQLYKIQNDKFSAIKEFTIALNLDPKGNYLIREAMESLKE